MPRQAHGRSLHTYKQPQQSRSRKQKPKRSNALNALEVAEKQNPDTLRIRQHRLGQVEGDNQDHPTTEELDERSSKRRKVTDTRDAGTDDEANGSGDLASGSDEEGGRWHEGVEGSDEDSDIDSDEAFGESDEERFADYTFRGSQSMSKPSKRKPGFKAGPQPREIDLDEEEGWQDAGQFNDEENIDHELDEGEEDSDDLGEDAVDLATALDMNLEEERKEVERSVKGGSRKMGAAQSGRRDSSDDESDASDSDHSSDLSIEDEDAEGDHVGLQSFVSGLDKADSDTDLTQSRRPNRAISDRPSTFGLASAKITAADLAQYITDPAQRQALKLVQANEKADRNAYSGGIPGKLSAPLAKRQQDKLDREAAYGKSKETLNRWIDTVKNNRRAEHLSFPLIDPGSQGVHSTHQLPQTTQLAPRTELESTIQEILEESGAGSKKRDDFEEQQAAYEELEEKKIPLQDVRERRAQLRLARELMFREEIRAKRIKKIKSKAYRRVHRKERDRIEAQQREQLAAAGLLNSDEEREQNDRRRAEERMGARHKESKWAKGVKQAGRTAWDDDARVGVSELARRDEELRRRVEGRHLVNSDLSESESESETDAEDSEAEQEGLRKKLSSLQAGPRMQSKLGSMAFMQRAEAARKAENDEEIRQLQLAVSGETNVMDESETNNFQPAGRQKYGASSKTPKEVKTAKPTRNEFEAMLSEDGMSDHEPSQIVTQTATTSAPQKSHPGQRTTKQGHNKTDLFQEQKTGSGAMVQHGRQQSSAKQSPGDIAHHAEETDYTSNSDTDDTAAPANADTDQAALAASIFAGPDDTSLDFEREKALIVEEEADQVVDDTLPGWGNWTGTGISKREQRKGKGRFLTRIAGVAPEQRRDAKLNKVIINEKRIKKNGRYLATELPHPFETRQQYERSLRLPMGPEWSTVNHFQDAIKPRILLKQGTVIAPIAKPSA